MNLQLEKNLLSYYKSIALLFRPNSPATDVKYMSLSKFSKLLQWFGPLSGRGSGPGMLECLMQTMQKPWFFGICNKDAAVAKLENARDGEFLIRLNTGVNEPIKNAPWIISIKWPNKKDKFVHYRVCPSTKDPGSFYVVLECTSKRDLQGVVHELNPPEKRQLKAPSLISLVDMFRADPDLPCKFGLDGSVFSQVQHFD